MCSAHFETVLEHAHEQLQMALALNDSVDKRWMEDVQRRNKQTLEGMKQFQTKCQRLYEERLKDYVASTEDQLRRYESQLLEAGARAATEKGSLRSQVSSFFCFFVFFALFIDLWTDKVQPLSSCGGSRSPASGGGWITNA